MIDWKSFYANGGYYGLNDPDFYDDGVIEEKEEDIPEYKYDEKEQKWKKIR